MRVKLGVLQPGKILGFGNGASAQTLVTSTTNVVSVTSNYTTSVFNPHYVRATTLTFADQLQPGAAPRSILPGGSVTLFKTVVTADASKSANLYKIAFYHKVNGVTVNNYRLKINGTELATGDVSCSLASDILSCTFGGLYANGYSIDNSTNTIEVVAAVSSPAATSDIVTYLQE